MKKRIRDFVIVQEMKNQDGMEMVQVAILIAIAVVLGLIFKTRIVNYVDSVFTKLQNAGF